MLDTPQLDKLLDSIAEAVYERLKERLNQNKAEQPTNESDEPQLLSIEQVRHLTKPPISRTSLYYWTKANKLQAYKVGKRVFYSKKAVLSFLTSVVKKPPKI